MYNYREYNNLFWIFLIQISTPLQSMYNHMVGRTASVISIPYSLARTGQGAGRWGHMTNYIIWDACMKLIGESVGGVHFKNRILPMILSQA